jgi:hypothetical protein
MIYPIPKVSFIAVFFQADSIAGGMSALSRFLSCARDIERGCMRY